jgi:predicted PolB exonuclease-like 3'-5' exonuclease
MLDVECAPVDINDLDVWIYLSEKATTRTMHPVFSKIISIAIKVLDEEQEILYGDDEHEILEEFWGKIAAINPDKIVTFNGYGFDIPFIYVRSMINKIEPTKQINCNKWNMETSNHFDCMLALSYKGAFLNVAQDIICKMLSIEVPDKIDGREIEKCYVNKNWASINNRCQQDVIALEQIYKKLVY